MPRRNLLSPAERSEFVAFPTDPESMIQHYTFSESDLAVIGQRRRDHNRLGFAAQLCYLRYPGFALPIEEDPPTELLAFVCRQLKVDQKIWPQYSKRQETRREHLNELQAWLKLAPFTVEHHRCFVQYLSELAQQTDRGVVLVEALIKKLREEQIVLPVIDVLERIGSEALSLGTRMIYEKLTSPLTDHHQKALDALLTIRKGSNGSILMWLRQSCGIAKPRHILAHLERLKTVNEILLPDGLGSSIHQNRLLKISREGGQMTSQHLQDLEPVRRYATLVAVILDARSTLIDEIIDLHDRFLGSLFSTAHRKHADRFHESGKEINNKVRLYSKIGRALLNAKASGENPFEAIEAIIPWEAFQKSILEAENLSQPEDFDYFELLTDGFNQLRRYIPTLLSSLNMRATPAARDLLNGVKVLEEMHQQQARKVPENAPTSFIRKRWGNLIYTDHGLDRRFYEICVLSELKNALRSGDIWVQGSRQFKDFEDYLLPNSIFFDQCKQDTLDLPIETDCEHFLAERLTELKEKLITVEALASAHELPDAMITSAGRLKITPLDNAVPHEALTLAQEVYGVIPQVKITELLLEVDSWTGFTQHFTHLKSGETVENKNLLLTALLADGINLGLNKMADACPGTTYAKLAWTQAWYIREDTYSASLAELVNAQSREPFAKHWGDGTTSSSDGQNFKVGARGKFAGKVNMKYGPEPGVQFYTHISDQYASFHINAISSTLRDSTYVLDGLLYHESDLIIKEHYTDTAGFTDHVFGLMQLLGFHFVPRIRDLADKRLFITGDAKQYPTLSGLIGGTINIKQIREHWHDILRLAASIKQGKVTASLMLRKLGSYPRQNGLALALRELGRIERTLFTLNWMQSVDMRRCTQIGLNKCESKHALGRAVFLNRLGELRDRSFENQRYRASGLNLIISAIVLWNTVYLDKSINALQNSGKKIDHTHLSHVSPVSWGHINLTGDYVWSKNKFKNPSKFRPLRII